MAHGLPSAVSKARSGVKPACPVSKSSTKRSVAIVLALCSRQREPFGIRFERADTEWQGDWAFALKRALARREGYDGTRIEGGIVLAPAYPGCPHCSARSIWRCGACTKVACWDGETRDLTCPNCKGTSTLSGTIAQLDSGGDA